jgi:hypothetical protein
MRAEPEERVRLHGLAFASGDRAKGEPACETARGSLHVDVSGGSRRNLREGATHGRRAKHHDADERDEAGDGERGDSLHGLVLPGGVRPRGDRR